MVYVEGRTPTRTTPRGRLGVKWSRDAPGRSPQTSDMKSGSRGGRSTNKPIKPALATCGMSTLALGRESPTSARGRHASIGGRKGMAVGKEEEV